jgi:hypothetical protein
VKSLRVFNKDDTALIKGHVLYAFELAPIIHIIIIVFRVRVRRNPIIILVPTLLNLALQHLHPASITGMVVNG